MNEQNTRTLIIGGVDDSSLTFDADYTDEMVESITVAMEMRAEALEDPRFTEIHGRNPYGENGNRNGNGNGHTHDEQTPIPSTSHAPEDLPNDTQERFGLSEVASMFSIDGKRLSPQRLLHWIDNDKYKVVTPTKERKYQDNDVYSFGPEEVAQVASVVQLLESGYKMREIVEMVGQQDEHKEARSNLLQAFAEWSTAQNQTAREAIVQSIASIPSLEPKEKTAFLFMQMGGSFPECAQTLGLDSEEAARKVLDEAHYKIGRYFFHLLLSAALTPPSAT